MSKLLGAIVGFALGGPVGAIAGAAVGGVSEQQRRNRINPSVFNRMQSQVQGALAHEDETGAVYDRVSTRFHEPGAANEVVEFIRAYVAQTPDLLQGTYQSTIDTHLEPATNAVFQVIVEYFFDEYDVIPDHEGLFGLLDDAYLARRLVERVLLTTGVSRDQVQDLVASNDYARLVLGDRFGAQLDQRIDQTMAHPDSTQTMQMLAQNNFGGFVGSRQPYHGINFKREFVRDAIRHDLAKDGIYF